MSSVPAQHREDRRDRILDGVAAAVDLLLEEDHWQQALPGVLRALGIATGVSRVYYFTLTREVGGAVLASQIAEWVAEGVEPQIDNPDLQRLDMHEAGFGRWLTLLEAGEPVHGDVAEFPEPEQPILQMQDIKSLVVQPVAAGRTLVGLIGFDACNETKSWSSIEVGVLRIAARTLGAGILRESREQAWRQSEQMAALGRMAAGVAHDFNNLLTVLSASLQLARLGLEGEGGEVTRRSALSSLETSDRALTQATSLARRLLDFGRARGGRPERVVIPDLLADMRPLIEQAVGRRVRVSIRCVADVPPVRMDPAQLRQVILNLAGNAHDAMPEGGDFEIEVSTLDGVGADQAAASSGSRGSDGASGTWVVLTMHDTGTGIPETIRERIFEPFFTTKPPEQGTGLGLANAYANVRAAGGRLTIRDDGRPGTTFRMQLPGDRLSTDA
jgi:signal transduction histidine kinase